MNTDPNQPPINQHMNEFPAEPRTPFQHPYPPAQLPPQIIIQNTANAAAAAGGHVHWKKTNHVLHALVTLCTGGLWIPGWVYFTWRNNKWNREQGAYARAGR